jgi:hypothetical protein
MITLAGYALFVHMLSFIVLTLRHTLFRGTLQPITEGTTTVAEQILAETVIPAEETSDEKPSSSEKEKPLVEAGGEVNYYDAEA